MKSVISFFGIILCGYGLSAQPSQDSIKTTVNALFSAMKNSDGLGITTVFGDSALLQSIVSHPDGRTEIRNELVRDFSTQISKLPKGVADERIIFETIRIDGELAMVWAPYQFYYNGKLHHCGVDSFQLVRIKGEWKIQYLIDTRRKECP
jgi:hypothetical protein